MNEEPTNAEILAAVDALNEKFEEVLKAFKSIEEQAAPIINSLSTSPILRMLGVK